MQRFGSRRQDRGLRDGPGHLQVSLNTLSDYNGLDGVQICEAKLMEGRSSETCFHRRAPLCKNFLLMVGHQEKQQRQQFVHPPREMFRLLFSLEMCFLFDSLSLGEVGGRGGTSLFAAHAFLVCPLSAKKNEKKTQFFTRRRSNGRAIQQANVLGLPWPNEVRTGCICHSGRRHRQVISPTVHHPTLLPPTPHY